MPRNEESMNKTNSTFYLFYLVFLWRFAPCFRPDSLVFTLIVATDESPRLMFCPLYHFTKFLRATVYEQMCLGLRFLHVHVALKF